MIWSQLSFPVISAVFLFKTFQPRSGWVQTALVLWHKSTRRKVQSLFSFLEFSSASASSTCFLHCLVSPAVHGSLSCHLVPCSKLGGTCFLWKEISFPLASAPRITQGTAVGGPCSVGGVKTSCSFVLFPQHHMIHWERYVFFLSKSVGTNTIMLWSSRQRRTMPAALTFNALALLTV